MKAAVVEKPGVLTVRDVPEPVVGPYDALCDILYCATCTATDRHILEGNFCYEMQYPAILGHESIGRVREVGERVRSFHPGDLVTRVAATAHPEAGLFVGWGGFAERGIVRDALAMDADGVQSEGYSGFRMNQVLPADMNPADATILINWRETWSAITRMGVGYGARVLVLGSGGVGLSFVAHAHNLLAAEVAVVGSPARFDLARRLGATQCFDYHEEDLAAALGAACPESFDFLIDAVGRRGQIDRVLPRLGARGGVALYGVDDYFSVTITPTLAPGGFRFLKEGYAEWEATDAVLRLIGEGRLRPQDFYDPERIFPLERINDAFAATKNREMLKAVVRCSP
jgi:L-iditol 2-dehydrogenase